MRFPQIENPLPPLSEFVVTKPSELTKSSESIELVTSSKFLVIILGQKLAEEEYSVERVDVGEYVIAFREPQPDVEQLSLIPELPR